jgi:hypothetical protein
MRLTLHDNIHASAGVPHPEARASIPAGTRASWVAAMHRLLARAGKGAAGFAADFNSGGVKLRMRARRHGTSASAVWSVGPAERVVAASILLAGRDSADDAAAIAAIRQQAPRLPFEAEDYARLTAEPRPCLGTLYLDAAWYNNSRVELAATALASASLDDVNGRLARRDDMAAVHPASSAGASEATPRPSARTVAKVPPRGGRWFDGSDAALKFDFTRPRLQLVMQMVNKKGKAAIGATPGPHFLVYPPRTYLNQADVLRGSGIFDRFKDSAWCVRWHDGRQDRLSFGEFLGFLHQIVEMEAAYFSVAGHAAPPADRRIPQNDSTWGPRPSAGDVATRQPVKVRRVMNTRELTKDTTIRHLLSVVTLEAESLADQD